MNSTVQSTLVVLAAGNQQVELQLTVTRRMGVCTWYLPESDPVASSPPEAMDGMVGIILKFNSKTLPATITSPSATGYKFTVKRP